MIIIDIMSIISSFRDFKLQYADEVCSEQNVLLTSFRCKPAVTFAARAGREFMIAVSTGPEGFDECHPSQADCLNETLATSIPDGHVSRLHGQL